MLYSAEPIWIVGYGKFGKRAVDRIIKDKHPPPPVTVIDIEKKDDIHEEIKYVQADGVKWFVDNFQKIGRKTRIIPALPVHFAAQFIKRILDLESNVVNEIEIPEKILSFLPNPYRISNDTYVFSHADFLCPPDCIEPDDFCTSTGKPRPTPLYELMASIAMDDVAVITIKSHQFAPGVGGFYGHELLSILSKVRRKKDNSILLCTACKCHGIVTSFQLLG